jgi:hypothetical protein
LYVDIDDFDIDGSNTGDAAPTWGNVGIYCQGDGYSADSYCRVRGNRVHDFPAPPPDSSGGFGNAVAGAGGDVAGVGDEASGNLIFNIWRPAIPVDQNGGGHCIYAANGQGKVVNNIMHNCGEWGIHAVSGNQHDSVIANNLVFNTGTNGIIVGTYGIANNALVVNNIVIGPYEFH